VAQPIPTKKFWCFPINQDSLKNDIQVSQWWGGSTE